MGAHGLEGAALLRHFLSSPRSRESANTGREFIHGFLSLCSEAVAPISPQHDNLFDQMEILEQVAVTESISGAYCNLKHSAFCKPFLVNVCLIKDMSVLKEYE